MLATLRLLLGVLFVFASCQPGPASSTRNAQNAQQTAVTQPNPPAAVSAAPAGEPDLSEPDLPPLVPVAPDEVQAPFLGPPVLYGEVAARGRRRADAPGRKGDLLIAIDSPYQIFGRSASYLHVAAWTGNGAPAAGARVYVNREQVGRTDGTGTLVFRHEGVGDDTDSFEHRSIFVVDAAERCGSASFSPFQRTKTFAVDRLFVYTDRGVFQPGETVHIRAIGWRLKHDYSPLVDAPIEFLLRSSSGRTIAAASATTDEFGVTATDVKVPYTAGAGIYELRVAYGEERASTRLQVRRFKPPALRIEHTLGRFLLRTTRRALDFRVTVHPPASQALEWLDVQAVAKAPSGKLVARFATRVRGNGPHALSFSEKQVEKLIAATPEGDLATVELKFRDNFGREETLTRELRVTGSPYVSILELDRDEYATGDPVSVVARVSDRDSVPLRNKKLHLTLEGGPRPLVATTDQGGMARFSLQMPNKSREALLSIPGEVQPIARTTLPWREPIPMRTELGSPVIKERQTTSVAAFFPAKFSPVERHVHMDIVDTSGAIVGSRLLAVRREKGRFVARGQFKAPSWGSMLLTFFALGRPDKAEDGALFASDDERPLGLFVGGQSLVVQTDRELQVTLEGLPGATRPGSPLEVRARIRDHAGQEVEASVGAALVDRNILALKDPLEITPMDRFYNPELRTLSTTGSKILTWPVVTRNWGRRGSDSYRDRLIDIALPPFEWQDGGAVASCKEHWDAQDYEAAGEALPQGGFGAGFGSGGAALGVGRGARVEITIRTRFPATSLWEPRLRGKGLVDIRGRFPDTIGEQELIVVASDKRGGVGMVRTPVRVTQPVFIEADLPAPAVVGDEVWVPAVVHNSTERPASFAVELNTEAGGKHSRSLTVASGAAGATALPLRVNALGPTDVQVRAVGAGHDDRVVRRIDVAARGVPIARLQSATLSSAKPLRLEFDVPAIATDADASLRIDVPVITSAFVDMDGIAAIIEDQPWSLASDLVSTSLVLDLARRNGLRSDALDELRGRAIAALALTARVQATDGSFSYWRNGKPSPFITAKVLEGLLEARRIGLPAPASTIKNAAERLAAHLDGGGLVDVSDIGWWEGQTERVRTGITAEIFDVLARLRADERRGAVGAALRRLVQRYRDYLEQDDLDLLAAGRALSALLRLGEIEADQAGRVAQRLVRRRDEDHFEPSWFHAYGGRVDTTLAVLEALQLADPNGHLAEKRDALAWILSTRPSWGAWHNEAGTAAALRAIALVGGAPDEVASTVVVKLDGKVVHTAHLDPKDPMLSAASLAHLDLGTHIKPGRHVVEVLYNGKLRPAVSVTSRFWHTGKSGPASGNGVTLGAIGQNSVKAGKDAALQLDVTGGRIAGGTLVIGHSGLLELDLAALGSISGRGRPIAEVRATERGLELLVASDATAVHVALPFHASRRGRGYWPVVAWFARGSRQAEPLVVDPGRLLVD